MRTLKSSSGTRAGLSAVMVVLAAYGVAAAFAADAGTTAMGGHMTMTDRRPATPGDQQRAQAVVEAARQAMAPYADFHKALADGYTIFHPDVPQKVYHFTKDEYGIEAWSHFDATRPTSLLYEKTSSTGQPEAYKLIGVMYTDRYSASLDELNERIPLSVASWHMHTNLCLPPNGVKIDYVAADPKFGLRGSITTAVACEAAGGRFLSHLFGWMVHVYPDESDPAKIWAAGMDDEHGMQHDGMAGMTPKN